MSSKSVEKSVVYICFDPLNSYTKNLSLASDPACLFIDTSTPEGQATGLVLDSAVSCLVLMTVYAGEVAQVLGAPSPAMTLKLDGCLKAALGLP